MTVQPAPQLRRLDVMRRPMGRQLASLTSGWLEQRARRSVHDALARIEEGEILVVDDEAQTRHGRQTDEFPELVQIVVHHPSFHSAVALGGILGSGEAFMEGAWSCDDLPLLVRILLRNHAARAEFDGRAVKIAKAMRRSWEATRRNTRVGSRRNVEAHFDLGNEFFNAFLDPTLTYSCGLFETQGASMEEASVAKYDRLAAMIDLKSDDHVLDIGCGWGGFAIHAATRIGCRVTATTISREQQFVAQERVTKAGLDDRVKVVLDDYRDLDGQYDKIVSIEMVESVGAEFIDEYFATCSRLLRPSGAMALQAVTIADDQFESARDTVDFIRRYVFPGACLPSLGVIRASLERGTDMQVVSDFDITPHYAETLRRWRDRFLDNRESIEALGYPERFQRMWLFYLGYSEGGFEAGRVGTHQIAIGKPDFERPAEN